MNTQDLKTVGDALAARHTRLNRARSGAEPGASRVVTMAAIAALVMAVLFGLLFVASS